MIPQASGPGAMGGPVAVSQLNTMFVVELLEQSIKSNAKRHIEDLHDGKLLRSLAAPILGLVCPDALPDTISRHTQIGDFGRETSGGST
jgi:hypothetical protein